MRNKKIIQISVLVMVLITIAINLLSNVIPFNNVTTKELSDAIPTFFVPAGYVFSIWGIIYVLFLVYSFSLFKNFKKEDSKIFYWFILSCIANISWLLLWHYKQVAISVVPMVILLTSLIAIYIITDTKTYPWYKRILFQTYLGWISVATIANISSALYVEKWYGFGISAEIWAVILIGVATNLSILITTCKKDYIYTTVILWAMIGIMYKFYAVSDLVTAGSLVSIMVLLMTIFVNSYCAKEISWEKR